MTITTAKLSLQLQKKKGLDEHYVENALEHHAWQTIPLTYRRSFSAVNMTQTVQTSLLIEQKKVIGNIAETGKNCVIVGRNADILLAEQNPFRIFVCADQEAKVRRCMERAQTDEKLSRKEIISNMQRIDKNRAKTREIITGSKWGDYNAYHLIVNTTDWNIRDLTPAVADFAVRWFRR